MTHALAFNCTLKPSPELSSTGALISDLFAEFAKQEVTGEQIRVVDEIVAPGTLLDMGDGDDWPRLRERLLAADILVFGTPTWMGHMSSVAQRVLERLDAELSETDQQGRLRMAGKVAVTVVVGNEDGAHKITADLYQALADVGFTIPSQGGTYWNGEAMHTTNYNDLGFVPETVARTNAKVARNAAHLARLLAASPYPAR